MRKKRPSALEKGQKKRRRLPKASKGQRSGCYFVVTVLARAHISQRVISVKKPKILSDHEDDSEDEPPKKKSKKKAEKPSVRNFIVSAEV